MTVLTPTDKTAAVNIMLGVIGESPVSTLAGSTNVDVRIAEQILDEHLVECLSRGWRFNSDNQYSFSVEAVAPYACPVPANAVQLTRMAINGGLRDLSVRDGKIWDRENHSFEFDGVTEIKADVVWLFDFEDCPQAARRYVTLKAAEAFQKRMVGSETLYKISADDMRRAWADLRKFEAKTRKANLLTDNWAVARVLNRRA